MTAGELLVHLRSLDVQLWADGDRLHYSAPKGVLTPALRTELAARKAEILTLLDKEQPARRATLPPLSPVARSADLPLSFAQQRLWFLDQLEPGNSLYNIPMAVRLQGCLHVEALHQALNALVARHETLRTSFISIDGNPMQRIAERRTVALPVVDLSIYPELEREAQALRLASKEARRPFNLGRDLLLRATLLRLDPEEHILLLTLHHIASDDWSMGILMRELTLLYEAFARGAPSPLPVLPIQYADYAVWQRQWLQGEILEKQLSYWKQQLGGSPPVLELPTDRPRPAIQTSRGARHSLLLPKPLSDVLKALSRREGVTLFMTLLAAFQTLLHRYTGQGDILVGSPIANRTRAELEGLIGFFVNTLVLRTDLSGNLTFWELLGRVRKVTLEAYAHQDLPFERLVEELQPERSLSHSPLFQVMFVLQNAPRQTLTLPGLSLTSLKVDNGTAKFDVTLALSEDADGLRGWLEYNADLFEAATIGRLAGHFQILLESIVAHPEQRLSELPLLSAVERQQLLVEWNATQTEYPQDQCLHQLFDAQVEHTPDATAVIFEDKQLTYRELNRRANQVAHHLQALGVGPEVLVGLYMERSIEMMIGLLGILKAGGAYVPLDPAYPKERLAFMLEDAQVPVLLTQQRLAKWFLEHEVEVVCLDSDWEIIARESQENPASGVLADNLAYVIYTSGSTGQPKGVMVAHRGLCNMVEAEARDFGVRPGDRVLQFASLGFDASIFEIAMTLPIGATLCLGPQEGLMSGQILRDQAITVAALPPSLLAILPAKDFPTVQTVFSIGEACTADIIAHWAPGRRFFNPYGPTETTCYVTVAECVAGSQKPTIGHPIINTQIYLLDPYLQPVPIGVPGELYISGEGLARGYLNSPDLTAEKFIPNPFSEELGARMYKTGDMARYLPDGNVEFLGRLDHQVKIRGFRVELGEIETVLSHHPAVQDTVVVAREDVPGDKRLVAYVVPHPEQVPTSNELRSFLKEKLPDYMLPAAFILLAALPLLPSGKVDRRALPALDLGRPESAATFVAPRNPVEEVLAGIWADILNLERVGIHDNFFALGGHSLLATQIISRLRRALQVEVAIHIFFEAPTVAGFAETIANIKAQTEQPEHEEMGRLLTELEGLPDEEIRRLLGDLRR